MQTKIRTEQTRVKGFQRHNHTNRDIVLVFVLSFNVRNMSSDTERTRDQLIFFALNLSASNQVSLMKLALAMLQVVLAIPSCL